MENVLVRVLNPNSGQDPRFEPSKPEIDIGYNKLGGTHMAHPDLLVLRLTVSLIGLGGVNSLK